LDKFRIKHMKLAGVSSLRYRQGMMQFANLVKSVYKSSSLFFAKSNKRP